MPELQVIKTGFFSSGGEKNREGAWSGMHGYLMQQQQKNKQNGAYVFKVQSSTLGHTSFFFFIIFPSLFTFFSPFYMSC